MKCIIGIDPGQAGAIARLWGPHGLSEVFDFEKLKLNELAGLFMESPYTSVFIEKAQVMPRRRRKRGSQGEEIEIAGQGAVGMFRYGVHYGTYLGILIALKIPFQEVHPMTWKKEFGLLRQPKERSIHVAQQLFPSLANQLTRKKDHGRAEALLIGEWGRRHYQGQKSLNLDEGISGFPTNPSSITLP